MKSSDIGKWKESEVTQSCLTLCDPMDYSLPGSSVHGIFQARILESVAISFSRGSFWPRDRTLVSCIVGRRFTVWATREVLNHWSLSSQIRSVFAFGSQNAYLISLLPLSKPFEPSGYKALFISCSFLSTLPLPLIQLHKSFSITRISWGFAHSVSFTSSFC